MLNGISVCRQSKKNLNQRETKQSLQPTVHAKRIEKSTPSIRPPISYTYQSPPTIYDNQRVRVITVNNTTLQNENITSYTGVYRFISMTQEYRILYYYHFRSHRVRYHIWQPMTVEERFKSSKIQLIDIHRNTF